MKEGRVGKSDKGTYEYIYIFIGLTRVLSIGKGRFAHYVLVLARNFHARLKRLVEYGPDANATLRDRVQFATLMARRIAQRLYSERGSARRRRADANATPRECASQRVKRPR